MGKLNVKERIAYVYDKYAGDTGKCRYKISKIFIRYRDYLIQVLSDYSTRKIGAEAARAELCSRCDNLVLLRSVLAKLCKETPPRIPALDVNEKGGGRPTVAERRARWNEWDDVFDLVRDNEKSAETVIKKLMKLMPRGTKIVEKRKQCIARYNAARYSSIPHKKTCKKNNLALSATDKVQILVAHFRRKSPGNESRPLRDAFTARRYKIAACLSDYITGGKNKTPETVLAELRETCDELELLRNEMAKLCEEGITPLLPNVDAVGTPGWKLIPEAERRARWNEWDDVFYLVRDNEKNAETIIKKLMKLMPKSIARVPQRRLHNREVKRKLYHEKTMAALRAAMNKEAGLEDGTSTPTGAELILARKAFVKGKTTLRNATTTEIKKLAEKLTKYFATFDARKILTCSELRERGFTRTSEPVYITETTPQGNAPRFEVTAMKTYGNLAVKNYRLGQVTKLKNYYLQYIDSGNDNSITQTI